MSFNFMAAVTICSDFGAQENKVSDMQMTQFLRQKVKRPLKSLLMKVKEEVKKLA